MNKQFIFVIITLIFLELTSCGDATNIPSDVKSDTVRFQIRNLVNFNFENANLIIQPGDTTPVWTANKPELWGIVFIPYNRNSSGDLSISTIKSKSNLFKPNTKISLPLILKKGELNYNNDILLQLDTKNLNSGLFEDWIYFNDMPEFGFQIRINIK